MREVVTMTVDGDRVSVPSGTTVAAAVMIAGKFLRTSVTGEPRGPLCGMGICFECRLAINGTPHARSCQVLCEEGMEVRTDA
jgi:D-hydroxyproline dehydrogenase subunit gamma